MKICLVIPPSPFLISDRALPWLGPLWVAAWLRQKGYDVAVLDLTGYADYLDRIRAYAGRCSFDCYGVSSTTPDYPAAAAVLKAIREVAPGAKVILGGAHATTSPQTAIRDGWDSVLVGDGFLGAEAAIIGTGIVTAVGVWERMDDLPFPARDLVDLNSYNFRVVGERATSAMTSFGCPRQCTFCCGRNLPFYRRLRAFSPKRVLREWDAIRSEYPQFRALMDPSDEWNLPEQRALSLAEAIAAHPTKWILRCFVRADHFTDAVASAMRRAGVVEALCGVESGSERILRVVKKGTTPDINGMARERARKYGIRFKALTMVGLPTESREDALATKAWILRYRPDDFDCTVYQPMRGSPIADRPDKEGAGLFFTLGTQPYKTIPGHYHTTTRTSHLDSAEIVALRDEIERDCRQELGLPSLSEQHEASMGQPA